MLISLITKVGWDELHQKLFNRRESSHAVLERVALDPVEDELDPRMVARVIQAVEGFAKSQVTDDIKSRPVVPRDHVQSLGTTSALFMKSLEEKVHVLLHDGFLLQHRLRGEAMRQGPSKPRVVFAVGADDAMPAILGCDRIPAVVTGAVL